MSAAPLPPALPFPLDPATFRALFAQFADATAYPDATVQVWLDQGFYMVNCGWGPAAGFGQALWAAHEMAKLAMATQNAQGGNPSGIGGIVQMKTVGPVSVTYDTAIGVEAADAGQYNLTIYGRQYWHFAQLYGSGPVVSDPSSPVPPFSGPGWWGPPFWIPGW